MYLAPLIVQLEDQSTGSSYYRNIVSMRRSTLYSGHYMAKVRKLMEDGSEFNNNRSIASTHSTSDSCTTEASVDEVHSSQAYLFYERTCLPGWN